MYTLALATILTAILFFRAADYERMSPWAWTLGSLSASAISIFIGGGLRLLIVGQVGLFLVMWWYNFRRQARTRH